MKPKEFFKKWGEGIQKITPFQQLKISLIGTTLVFIGIIIGIITMIINKTWWLLIILCGSFIIISTSFLGAIQKYKALKKIDEVIKLMEVQNE